MSLLFYCLIATSNTLIVCQENSSSTSPNIFVPDSKYISLFPPTPNAHICSDRLPVGQCAVVADILSVSFRTRMLADCARTTRTKAILAPRVHDLLRFLSHKCA